MRQILLSLLLLTLQGFAQTTGNTGTVSGTVTDSEGRPIADAVVTASIKAAVHIGFVPKARTNEDGYYKMSLDFGTYFITAEKPEDDYPPMYLGLYSGSEQPPVITVSNSAPEATANVKLTKKAGVVAGTISDAQTGEPINANARIECVGDERRFVSGSGLTNATFRLLVPSDCPVRLTISQTGYAPWTFTRNDVAVPIELKASEVLQVEIKLTKVETK